MEIYSTYSARIKYFNHIFTPTVKLYRDAVNFFIHVLLEHSDILSSIHSQQAQMMAVEALTVITKKQPSVEHDFSKDFYKFPSYLRRAAIAQAIGLVSSYLSNLKNWEGLPEQEKQKHLCPSVPVAGHAFPVLYRGNMFSPVNKYLMNIKVFIRNTWDWLTVKLRKSDVDYIERRCRNRRMCAPTLQKRGKKWFLDFPFEEKVTLSDVPVSQQVAVAVDLGINKACTCSVMSCDGTVFGRHFLSLPKEYDSLGHILNKIKKQQHLGHLRLPDLWAKAKGVTQDISVKTAQFILNVAVRYNADVIVFEHLDLTGKKKGSKKQRLHLWKAKAVQRMVTDKAHRMGMRVSHINAWNTSRLAYDGSGRVLRGKESTRTGNNYSLCEFTTGKIYHCDLNATYNIGARYFIREFLKSLPERVRLQLEAKVPQACKRSTCTLSTLLTLHAEWNSIDTVTL